MQRILRSTAMGVIVSGFALWSSVVKADLPPAIPGKGVTWEATAGSSQSSSFDAPKAIDSNTGTYWQGSSLPTWHRIDMGERYRVTHYQFTIRDINHCIRNYEIYVTDSNANPASQGLIHPDWGTPVAKGTVPYGNYQTTPFLIQLQPKNGRYIIMRAVNVHANNATLREVFLYGYDAGPVMTVSPTAIRMYTDTSRAVSFSGIVEPPDPFVTTIQADLVVSDPDDIFESLVLDEVDVTAGGADLLTYTTAGAAVEGDLTVTASTGTGFGTIHVKESASVGYTPQEAVGGFVSIESVQRLVRVNGTTTIGLNLNSSDTRKIEIVDAQLGAPGDITVTIGTHTGSSATATADGSIDILNSDFTSTGSIRFESETTTGLTTIAVTVGNDFVFEETGTDTVIFSLATLPTDAVIVRETGNDVTGDGSAAAPFRTLTKALPYTPGISTVDIGPGLYNATAGEIFPVIVPGGASIFGPADASAILDADHAAWVMHVQNSATTEEISGLTLRRAKGTILRIDNWAGTLKNCVLADVANGGAWNSTSILHYNNGNNNRDLTLDTVTVRDVTTNVRHLMIFWGTGNYTITNSHFRGLKTSVASTQHLGNIGFRVATGGAANFGVTITDTIFEDIEVTATSGGGHAEGGFVLFTRGNNGFSIKRCIFRNITFHQPLGEWLIAANERGYTVENSLFHDIDAGGSIGAVIGGRIFTPSVHNCTIDTVNVPFRQNGTTHNISVYNSSISNFDALNRGAAERLHLRNVNLYGTEEAPGTGYSEADSANVTALNPKYRNAAAGDYRLAFSSQLVNAGDNAFVVGDFDLAGTPRISDGVVDLGAYETIIPPAGTVILIQ